MTSDRPIRVLLVCPTFGAYGGMEAFVFALADELAGDSRFDLRICFKRTSEFVMRPEFEALCADMPIEWCNRGSRELWSAIRWADVVHGQNASPDVSAAARMLRTPLALSIHNFLARRPLIRRWSWQASAVAADVRWYISRYVWDTWEPRHRPGSAHVPTITRLPRGFVDPALRRGFVFLGRLVPGKGTRILLDAYRHAKLDPRQWPLTILGDGPLRGSLELAVTRDELQGVHFGGFVDGEAKARALARSKWLVVPSHWQEPFGLVAREARHVSVPCIVTRDGGLPEAAGRDALVCAAGDTVALASALRAAAEMPSSEYAARSIRTKADLDAELVHPSFYAAAYVSLTGRDPAHSSPDPAPAT